MTEARTRTERKFVEGKGWELTEVPVDQTLTPGRVEVLPAQPVSLDLKNVSPEEVPDELIQRVLDHRGLVAVPREEHEQLMAELADIKPLISRESEQSPPAKGKGGKPKPVSAEEMEQRILEATSLDELTELMKDEKRMKILKLADERAAQIKEGEA